MRRGRKPATFGPQHLAALAFAADDDEMRSSEVAEVLGVSKRAIALWCRNGGLEARKAPEFAGNNGGIYLIRVADLRAFVVARSGVTA